MVQLRFSRCIKVNFNRELIGLIRINSQNELLDTMVPTGSFHQVRGPLDIKQVAERYGVLPRGQPVAYSLFYRYTIDLFNPDLVDLFRRKGIGNAHQP